MKEGEKGPKMYSVTYVLGESPGCGSFIYEHFCRLSTLQKAKKSPDCDVSSEFGETCFRGRKKVDVHVPPPFG